jgi:hypothetical protein
MKRNSPNVKTVMGSVTSMSNGFTKKLRTDSTSATSKAVLNLSTETPVCNTYDASTTAAAVINVFAIKFFIPGVFAASNYKIIS